MGVSEIRSVLAHVRPEMPPPELAEGCAGSGPGSRNPSGQPCRHGKRRPSSSLAQRLAALADTEKHQVTAILTELKQTLESGLAQPTQLTLDLADGQEDRNLEALRRRADAIPEEIRQECAQIDRRYADPAARLFPVAVAFLVPEREARQEAGAMRSAAPTSNG